AQHSRLAAAAGAEQAEKLARRDGETDVPQRHILLAATVRRFAGKHTAGLADLDVGLLRWWRVNARGRSRHLWHRQCAIEIAAIDGLVPVDRIALEAFLAAHPRLLGPGSNRGVGSNPQRKPIEADDVGGHVGLELVLLGADARSLGRILVLKIDRVA